MKMIKSVVEKCLIVYGTTYYFPKNSKFKYIIFQVEYIVYLKPYKYFYSLRLNLVAS